MIVEKIGVSDVDPSSYYSDEGLLIITFITFISQVKMTVSPGYE